MAELLGAVQDTPIPNLLVLAGIAFIFLAIVGGLTDKVTVPKERQRLIGLIGALLLVGGVGMHLLGGRDAASDQAAATPEPTALPAALAPTPIEPTATLAPPAPDTAVAPTEPPPNQPGAEPTAPQDEEPAPVPALPGVETVPLSQLAASIPWLPLDPQAIPGSYFYSFNATLPPFDDVRVRRAFIQATDRQALSTLANSLGDQTHPATSFTPPQTLGRDLFDAVGLPFDPAAAAALMAEAGYAGGEGFPDFKLVLAADPSNEALADAAASMWQANLGVAPEIEILDLEDAEFFERLAADPGNITVLGWIADYNDPDNFLYAAFDSESTQRVGRFSNPSFDRLVRQAATLANDPAARQRLYIEAERILADQAAILPIYHYIAPP